MEKEPLQVDDNVKRIAQQAQETYAQNGSHWDTYFYKVVLSGNVKVIKQVVAYMESNGAREALDWLFKRNEFGQEHKKDNSKRMWLTRICVYILLTVLTVLVTPLFYALHILSATFYNRKRKRISANIQLPLVYAAFSQNADMLLYFLGQGADVTHVDPYGNNIFHYIADLSAVAVDKALEIFRTVLQEMGGEDDVDTLKGLVESHRNSAGLTAVEYAAKFGSPSLLSAMQATMHHVHFSATHDQVLFDAGVQQQQQQQQQAASTRVERVDVSRYEAGTLTNQSTLLNILSDRDVCAMTESELQIFDADKHYMGKWLALKCKQMMYGVVSLQLIDFIITCFMLYALSTSMIGEQGANFKEWRQQADHEVQMAEVRAIANKTSSILKDHALRRLQQQQGAWHERSSLRILFERHPEDEERLRNLTGYDGEMSNVTAADVLRAAEAMPEYANDTDFIRAALSYPRLMTEFAKRIVDMESELFDDTRLTGIYYDWDEVSAAVTANFTFTDDDGIVRTPNLDYITFDICPSFAEGVSRDDLKHVPQAITTKEFEDIKNRTYDVCYYQMYVNTLTKKMCKSEDRHELLMSYYRDFNLEVSNKLPWFYIIVCYLYVVLDVLERCVFLTYSVASQTRVLDMVRTALSQKVPGSYTRKQLGLLSFIVIIISYHFQEHADILTRSLWDEGQSNAPILEELYKYAGYMTVLFIIAIVVRFLMHIHSLRLVPGIGHFIITTFMMGTNLLHFSAVFGVVLLIFAALFHILTDNPNCPLEKSDGFVTMADSMFSTFQLTFGHGDLDPFFSSAPVQLTYVLYVIIVGLLLLNLIIAIMSSTATEILSEPWKRVLWQMEWLDEATSAEYTFSILTLPLRSRLRSGFSQRKAGYIVQKTGKGNKVYIESFYCPALQTDALSPHQNTDA